MSVGLRVFEGNLKIRIGGRKPCSDRSVRRNFFPRPDISFEAEENAK